ncbi:4693_t:CDS:2 [Dentiscutata erythropus]|uniref:4693_t:CDS:1 n=1 Tax=Dentiscutata erythropus TaxID=1348616 RepID=A0A9N8ZZT3_9GLOM|nr:4693_t:CDS:2 [Dentiscutata erythropus]
MFSIVLLISTNGIAGVVSIGSGLVLTSILFSTILCFLSDSVSILVVLRSSVGYIIRSSIRKVGNSSKMFSSSSKI